MGDFIASNENSGDFLTFGEDGDTLFLYETVHQYTTTNTRKYTSLLIRIRRSIPVYSDWVKYLTETHFATVVKLYNGHNGNSHLQTLFESIEKNQKFIRGA